MLADKPSSPFGVQHNRTPQAALKLCCSGCFLLDTKSFTSTSEQNPISHAFCWVPASCVPLTTFDFLAIGC